jgi:hypothetical protein
VVFTAVEIEVNDKLAVYVPPSLPVAVTPVKKLKLASKLIDTSVAPLMVKAVNGELLEVVGPQAAKTRAAKVMVKPLTYVFINIFPFLMKRKCTISIRG